MSREEWTDRLADTLLREAVAGGQPPDLTAQILAHAVPRRRLRARRWVPLAAAAVLVVSVVVWTSWPKRLPPAYPLPVATGAYEVVDGGSVCRGAVLETTDAEAMLALGGYANVVMKAESSVVIAGRANAEEVVLTQGEVECDVQAHKGELFSVRTELGTVSVASTRFTVQLSKEEDAMTARAMTVRAIVGAVLVTGLGTAPAVLHAGERRTFGPRRPEAGAPRPAAQVIDEAKTPLEKARAAYAIQEQALRAQRQQIENDVLKNADVAAALKASLAASQAYYKELHEHPEYVDLKEARAKAAEDFRKLMSQMRGGRREDWQKRREEFRKLRTRSTELRAQMSKLADSVPEFVELKKKMQDALAAFLVTYQEKLKANETYLELGKQLDQIGEWLRDLESQIAEERRAERNAGGAGGE